MSIQFRMWGSRGSIALDHGREASCLWQQFDVEWGSNRPSLPWSLGSDEEFRRGPMRLMLGKPSSPFWI
jgi:hypothetical protein